MKFLKENWAIVLLAVVILGGAFYWYELRPIPIRKLCTELTWKTLKEQHIQIDNAYFATSYYNSCITNEGLSN